MPKVSEAHIEARRAQVLEAAFRCFASKGFHQTTMDDICREAELSPGAVYRYFPSKEDIIGAICDESRGQQATLIHAARQHESFTAVMDGLAQAYFSQLKDPTSAAGFKLNIQLWAEALHNPRVRTLLQGSLGAVLIPFTEIIRQAQKRGELNPSVDAESVARVMVALFHGLLVQKSVDPEVDVLKFMATMETMTQQFFAGGQGAKA